VILAHFSSNDKAHELYATMAEAGVPSEGSAGAVHESLSHLVCTINPHEIAQKGGAVPTVRSMRKHRLPRNQTHSSAILLRSGRWSNWIIW
jgi:hypothetical protein